MRGYFLQKTYKGLANVGLASHTQFTDTFVRDTKERTVPQ